MCIRDRTHSAQIGIIAQEQTEMKVAQSTLNEKCEEVSVKVDAIKQQVSNDKDQLTERQQRELNDIRDEMHRLQTIPNILSGLITWKAGTKLNSVHILNCLLYTSRCV